MHAAISIELYQMLFRKPTGPLALTMTEAWNINTDTRDLWYRVLDETVVVIVIYSHGIGHLQRAFHALWLHAFSFSLDGLEDHGDTTIASIGVSQGG